MLSVDHLFDLPNDIKQLIVSYDQKLWIMFAIYNDSFMKHTARNRKIFVNLFTLHTNDSRTQEWRLFNKLHRENDLPAIINNTGCYWWWCQLNIDTICNATIWYKAGVIHRSTKDPVTKLTLPAIISDEMSIWMLNGKYYREREYPTQVTPTEQIWMTHKHKIHRKHGPAKIITYKNEIIHEYWFRNVLHNYDTKSPAKIWYVNDVVTKQEWYHYGVLKKVIK